MTKNPFLLFWMDLEKYSSYSGHSRLLSFLLYRSCWSILLYRISNYLFYNNWYHFFKRFSLILMFPVIKMVELFNGISLPASAIIGSNFYIGHTGGVNIHPNVIIGENCNISKGVTIGISGRDGKRGCPVLGRNIFVGSNAVIVGKIQLEDNIVVAPNSLVINNFPKNVTICGVPASILSKNNSSNYL